MNFKKDDYKKYLEKRGNWEAISNKEEVLELFASLRSKEVSKFAPHRTYLFAILFPDVKKKKPTNVQYEHYLLWEYGYKYCPGCDTIKDVSSFTRNSQKWNKLQGYCRDCRNRKK